MQIEASNSHGSVQLTFQDLSGATVYMGVGNAMFTVTLKPADARQLVDKLAAAGVAASSLVMPESAVADLAAIKAKLGVGL